MQTARIACIQANSNRSPRLAAGLRIAANRGERPRKRWASQAAVRLCSRRFGGLGDRKVAAEGALRPGCGSKVVSDACELRAADPLKQDM